MGTQTGTFQRTTFAFKTSCGCAALDRPERREMTKQIHWRVMQPSRTSGLLLGRSEVLRSLRHYPRAQSQEHHTIDRLEERGLETENARRSALKGNRHSECQTNIGTFSKATLGKLLRDGVKRIIMGGRNVATEATGLSPFLGCMHGPMYPYVHSCMPKVPSPIAG